MLDEARDELVDREQRVCVDAAHVAQVLLKVGQRDLVVEQLLGEVERVGVVVLGRVVVQERVDDGHGNGKAEVDREDRKSVV